MKAISLTDADIRTKKAPESGRLELRDSDVPGLVLRITPSGVKSWSFTYNMKTERRRISLGVYSSEGVTLKLARERARELRGAVQRGEDPWQDRQVQATEAVKAKANGFCSCLDDYIEKYAKQEQKESTSKATRSILERYAVPEFGDRPVSEIRRRDIKALLEVVRVKTPKGKRGPFAANQLRATLSGMFRWLAVDEDLFETNPVTGIRQCVRYKPRKRALTDAEVVALWRAAIKVGAPFGPPIRVLLLTGRRREEMGALRWDEVDGDWAAIPGERMKNGRDFRAPLSGPAKAIIEAQPKMKACTFVFTTTGRTPISGWSYGKKQIDKQMAFELGLPEGEEVTPWRIHDLRRTLTTWLSKNRYSHEVQMRLMSHLPAASDVTTRVYNQYDYDDEAMEAVTKWASHVLQLVSGLEVVKATA